MRTLLLLTLVMAACDDNDKSDGTIPTTDTPADTDTDTDSDTDADTDADSDTDTTDSGGTDTDTTDTDTTDTGTVGGRTPGCAPAFVALEPDMTDCSSDETVNEMLIGAFVSETLSTWNSAGQLISVQLTDPYYGDELDTYTYDAVTGDVDTVTIDLGNDGSVEFTDVYAITYDASNNPIAYDIEITQSNGLVTHEIVTQTFGACGAETQDIDYENDGTIDESYTVSYFTDGSVTFSDVPAGGAVEDTYALFVDPVTGQPIHADDEFYTPHAGPEFMVDFNTFNADNQLTNSTAIEYLDQYGAMYAGLSYDIDETQTYDADGRQTLDDQTYQFGGSPIVEYQTATTWSCPP